MLEVNGAEFGRGVAEVAILATQLAGGLDGLTERAVVSGRAM
jgi:hypothetical protein